MTIKERFGFVTLSTLAAALVGGAISGHIFAARAVDAAAAPDDHHAEVHAGRQPRQDPRRVRKSPAKASPKSPSSTAPGTLRAGLGVGTDGAPATAFTVTTASRESRLSLLRGVTTLCSSTPTRGRKPLSASLPTGQSGLA